MIPLHPLSRITGVITMHIVSVAVMKPTMMMMMMMMTYYALMLADVGNLTKIIQVIYTSPRRVLIRM